MITHISTDAPPEMSLRHRALHDAAYVSIGGPTGDAVRVSQPTYARVCFDCHRPLAPTEAARKETDGGWAHVSCPSDADYAGHMAAVRPQRRVPGLPFRVDTPSPGVPRFFSAALWIFFSLIGLGMMTDNVAFGSIFAGVCLVIAVRASRCGVVTASASGVVARTTFWTYRWPWARIDHFSAETRLVGQGMSTRRVLRVYLRNGKSKWLVEILAKEGRNAEPINDAATDLNALHPDGPSDVDSSVADPAPVGDAGASPRPAPVKWVPIAFIAAAASIAILVAGPDWLWGAAVIPVTAARGYYLRLKERMPD